MAKLSTLVAPYKKFPLDGFGGVLLDITNPLNAASGGYTPSSQGALVKSTLLTDVGGGGYSLGANGFAYANGAWYTFVNCTMPVYTGRRKYEVWGRTADAALTNDYGIRILFNVSTQWTDYWELTLKWVTGTVFRLDLNQITASVPTTRATASFSTSLDVPALYHIILYEQGDALIAQCSMYEQDASADDEAVSISYSVASRQGKTTYNCWFSVVENPGTQWLIRGCRITDLAD